MLGVTWFFFLFYLNTCGLKWDLLNNLGKYSNGDEVEVTSSSIVTGDGNEPNILPVPDNLEKNTLTDHQDANYMQINNTSLSKTKREAQSIVVMGVGPLSEKINLKVNSKKTFLRGNELLPPLVDYGTLSIPVSIKEVLIITFI